MAGRFDAFTQPERDAMHDGLRGEAEIDEAEDPSFVERVRIANELLAEIEGGASAGMAREERLREALKLFAFPRSTSRRPSQNGPERDRPECDMMGIEVRAGDWMRACIALGTMDRDMLMALPENARPSPAFIDEVCPL